MVKPVRGSGGFAPVSQGGLRVRIFSEQDVPALVSVAAKSLLPGITPGVVVRELNLAFFGAYLFAEGARVELSPAMLEAQSHDIASKGRQLLRALGLPTEPRAYTAQSLEYGVDLVENLFRRSPIAHRLRREAHEVEPMPEHPLPASSEKLDLIDNSNPLEELEPHEVERMLRDALDAKKSVPLADLMVPTSIAKIALPLHTYSSVIVPLARQTAGQLHKDSSHSEAVYAVQGLLDMAPSAIALVIALAEMLEGRAGQLNTHKQNYRRTFRWSLFAELASAYFRAFGTPPNTSDKERGPNGPATKWVDRVLRVAARRPERITVVGVAGFLLADEAERQRLVGEIHAVARLATSVKAKSLRAGWRLRQDDLNPRGPESI